MAVLSKDPAEGFTRLPKESYDDYDTRTSRKLAELEATAAALPDGECVGAVLQFHIADGHAMYLVQKVRPLTLQHIPYADAYSIPFAHVKGLDLADVKGQVDYRKKMRALFASREPQASS